MLLLIFTFSLCSTSLGVQSYLFKYVSHSSLPFYSWGHHLASGPYYLVMGYNACHLVFSLPGSPCSKPLFLQINLPRVKPCSYDSPAQNPSMTFYYLLNNACNSYQFGRVKLSLILESVNLVLISGYYSYLFCDFELIV